MMCYALKYCDSVIVYVMALPSGPRDDVLSGTRYDMKRAAPYRASVKEACGCCSYSTVVPSTG